jgi:hypothetical protein
MQLIVKITRRAHPLSRSNWTVVVIQRRVRTVAAVAIFLFTSAALSAKEIDGIWMPDRRNVAGVHFRLNGMALRTYDILVRIYVVGLYLERPGSDPQIILSSTEPKLLEFVFIRNIDAADARKSWRESLDQNCQSTCRVSAASIAQFVASVPSVHEGDTSRFLFRKQGLDIFLNGQPVGRISDPDFSRLVLATFIGVRPSSDSVKLALLGASP